MATDRVFSNVVTAPQSVSRLERFLDEVLKPSLQQEMTKRDEFIQLAAQCTQLQQLCDEMKTLSCSGTSSRPVSRGAAARTTQRNELLVNLGNHFYTAARVADADQIYINIGCGVVLKMSVDDAKRHLTKRERLARDALDRQNLQVLRFKYRIRLVIEALRRLHGQYTGTEHA